MALTAEFEDLVGGGGSGEWLGDGSEDFGSVGLNRLRASTGMAARGVFKTDVPLGGSFIDGIIAASVVDIIDGIPFEVDNTSAYVSGSTDLVCKVSVWLRTEDAAVSVTPRVFNQTTGLAATVSGASACVATSEDYSGLLQQQTLLLTLASGVNIYRVQVTPSAATYAVYARAWFSLYID